MQANNLFQPVDSVGQKSIELNTESSNGRFVTQAVTAVGPHILLYAPTDDPDANAFKYAQNFSNLLHGSLTQFPQIPVSQTELVEAANHTDLMMVHEDRSWWQRWFHTSSGCKLVRNMKSSLLDIQAPRWPLRRILFVCRAEASDGDVMPWLIPLAQTTEAEVALLVIMPSIPALYRRLQPYTVDTAVILSPNTTSGQLLRSMLQELKRADIPVTLRLRDGEPDFQIRQETICGDYDLIMISAEPQGRLRRCLWGELVGPLFCWLDRPLFVARPIYTDPVNLSMETN